MCNIDGVVLFNVIKITLKEFTCTKNDAGARFSYRSQMRFRHSEGVKNSEACVTVGITACTEIFLNATATDPQKQKTPLLVFHQSRRRTSASPNHL